MLNTGVVKKIEDLRDKIFKNSLESPGSLTDKISKVTEVGFKNCDLFNNVLSCDILS